MMTTYYSGDVPSIIIADVREKGKLSVYRFNEQHNFFQFLLTTRFDDEYKERDIRVEHIWKYSAGGKIVEMEVSFFDGVLQLVKKSKHEEIL